MGSIFNKSLTDIGRDSVVRKAFIDFRLAVVFWKAFIDIVLVVVFVKVLADISLAVVFWKVPSDSGSAPSGDYPGLSACLSRPSRQFQAIYGNYNEITNNEHATGEASVMQL